jgi:hypothetical protein
MRYADRFTYMYLYLDDRLWNQRILLIYWFELIKLHQRFILERASEYVCNTLYLNNVYFHIGWKKLINKYSNLCQLWKNSSPHSWMLFSDAGSRLVLTNSLLYIASYYQMILPSKYVSMVRYVHINCFKNKICTYIFQCFITKYFYFWHVFYKTLTGIDKSVLFCRKETWWEHQLQFFNPYQGGWGRIWLLKLQRGITQYYSILLNLFNPHLFLRNNLNYIIWLEIINKL